MVYWWTGDKMLLSQWTEEGFAFHLLFSLLLHHTLFIHPSIESPRSICAHIHPSVLHSHFFCLSLPLHFSFSPGTQWPHHFLPNILLHLLLPPQQRGTTPPTTPRLLLSGPSASRSTRITRRTSWGCSRGGWAASSLWWCPSPRHAPACRCRRRCSRQSNERGWVAVEMSRWNRPAEVWRRRWRRRAEPSHHWEIWMAGDLNLMIMNTVMMTLKDTHVYVLLHKLLVLRLLCA